MSTTSPEYFRNQIKISFCSACDEAADRLWEIMCNQLKRNKAKEEGACQTQETVKPAIRIELNERGAIKVRTSFECLEKYRDNFIDEREFDPEAAMQPDLGLDAPADQEITEESFYDRVCGLDLREADLNMYFAQMPVKDFEHWLAEGNNRQLAAKILTDDRTRDDFCELVTSTLEALEDADEDTAEE